MEKMFDSATHGTGVHAKTSKSLCKRLLAAMLCFLMIVGVGSVGAGALSLPTSQSLSVVAQELTDAEQEQLSAIVLEVALTTNYFQDVMIVEVLSSFADFPDALKAGQNAVDFLAAFQAISVPESNFADTEAALRAALLNGTYKKKVTDYTLAYAKYKADVLALATGYFKQEAIDFGVAAGTFEGLTQLIGFLPKDTLSEAAIAKVYAIVNTVEIDAYSANLELGKFTEATAIIKTATAELTKLYAANGVVIPSSTNTIKLWGKTTKYPSNFLNWLLVIVCFGWIWMAF
jgi:hypothetical protein